METVLNVLFIFILRVLGISLSTVRILLMTRGRKLLSAALGFFEVLVYAVAIGKVVQDLNNIPNLISYCLGFSAGTLLGMLLEERIAIGFATIRVISPGQSQQVAEADGGKIMGQRRSEQGGARAQRRNPGHNLHFQSRFSFRAV